MPKPKKIQKFYLKDRLFNQEKVRKLSDEIFAVYKKFDKKSFEKETLEEFPNLELKERIYHIRDTLHKHLPQKYLVAIKIILKALPKELDPKLTDGDYGDFIYSPYSEYVAKFGIEKKYLIQSLSLLEEITKRFSVEYAIRHFINHHPKITLQKISKWSKHKNYHVRRLASEGSRPRLPWGLKINLHYTTTEKILDNLFHDKTRYVTRSVANHLNDISKIDIDFVFRKLNEWEKSKKQNEIEMAFIKKRALRTWNKKINNQKITNLKQ